VSGILECFEAESIRLGAAARKTDSLTGKHRFAGSNHSPAHLWRISPAPAFPRDSAT